MYMLAARLHGKEDLRVEEVPVPKINENEMLLRVKAALICGTDVRMYKNGISEYPRIICHEFAGMVEELGASVRGYTVGQRVTVAPNIGCGICDMCVFGQSHHCGQLVALGVHLDGGFAEYVKIPAEAIRLGNVTPIADSVSFEAAASNEALACAYNAYERYLVSPGDAVVIIGAGAIGLMHAKLAKMAGASKIIMNDTSETRLKEVVALEPSLVAIKDDLKKRVFEETNGMGANVVVTACSVAAPQQVALEIAAIDGRVSFFGGLPKDKSRVELDTNLIHYRQLIVTGTTRSTHKHYRNTLSFIASGLIDVDPLVTHKFELKDIESALSNAINAIGLRQAIVF